jgi:hypothetical protein
MLLYCCLSLYLPSSNSWWCSKTLLWADLPQTSLDSCLFFLLWVWRCLCLEVLGFALRASHLLVRCSTAWGTPPALFALAVLEVGSCFWPRPAQTTVLLFSWSSWDYRNETSHPDFSVEMLSLCLPGLALNYDSSDISVLISHDYKCEPPVLVFWIFWDKVSLYSPDLSGTQNPPVSVSTVLELQVCTTMPGLLFVCFLVGFYLVFKFFWYWGLNLGLCG